MTPETEKALETLSGALTLDAGTFIERQHTKGHEAVAYLRSEIERLERERGEAGYMADQWPDVAIAIRERAQTAEARIAELEARNETLERAAEAALDAMRMEFSGVTCSRSATILRDALAQSPAPTTQEG